MEVNGLTEVLTVAEIAALLKLSRQSIYRLVRKGLLPRLTGIRGIRVPRDGLDEYLSRRQTVQVPVSKPVFSQYRRSRAQKRTDDKDPNRHGLLGPIISQRRGGV